MKIESSNAPVAIPRALLLAASLALMCVCIAGAGAALADGTRPSIVVSGEAQVTAPPELARMQVSIISQKPEAAEAAQANARIAGAVRSALEGVLGQDAEVATEGYGVTPMYSWNQAEGGQRLLGYRAQNSIRVKTRDLDKVGPALDAALKAGANEVTKLEFDVEDDAKLRAQALARATRRARAKADAIAKALGVKILGVLEVTEAAGPSIRPMAQRATMMSAESDDSPMTPVNPGPISVDARVSLRVSIGG
jgi:uncharacterized protein YggE